MDDILDVTKSSEELENTAGKDLISDKATYPKLMGLEMTNLREEIRTQQNTEAIILIKGGNIYIHSEIVKLETNS